MAASAVSDLPPPPAPPPTSNAVEAFSPTPRSPNATLRELNTSRNKCLLPLIEPSHSGAMVTMLKSKAQPTSMTDDFLPSDLLFALKRQDHSTFQTSPRRGSKLSSSFSSPRDSQQGGFKSTKGSARLWNYPTRRERLRHLTEAPPCICGAGRDISFLYDSLHKDETEDTKSKKFVPSDTIIPEDYHIVKHPGVLGLEFYDEDYSVRNENHDYHMTIFPSTKPSGRHEASTLHHTFDSMLQRAGVPSEIKESDLTGPTEMHKLLDLVEKEQTIYNVIFHELIRQVSVHCVERGELLADLRRRYANLLDRIPRQVKSLHDEVLAQRTLDRKLTGELMKFRSKIASLSEELSFVKEHDLHVTEQSRLSEDNLSTALASSQKSAGMLNEYHDLYEMQRCRLEATVAQLTYDQELWLQATYELSWRVAEEYDLRTLQRLQLSEKAWCKLAGHFAILLNSRDSKQLSEVQETIQEWKEKLKLFLIAIDVMETAMKERLFKIRDGFVKWIEVYKESVKDNGIVTVPSHKYLGHLWAEMKIWQSIINSEAENFAGDNLINKLDSIKVLSALVEKWTSTALQVFARHQKQQEQDKESREAGRRVRLSIVSMSFGSCTGGEEEDEGKDDGEARIAEQFRSMVLLKKAIDAKMAMYECRAAGENGVATGFVHLSTPLESWDTKLCIILTSLDKKVFLPTSDWTKLGKLFEEWKEKIEDIISLIGTVPPPVSPDDVYSEEGSEEEGTVVSEEVREEEGEGEEGEEGEEGGEEGEEGKVERKRNRRRKGGSEERMKSAEEAERLNELSMGDLCVEVEKWFSGLSYAIDNQDSRQSKQVSRLHGDLLKWIVKLLLSLTETELQEKEEGQETHVRHIDSTSDLKSDYLSLAQALTTFTSMLNKSCIDVVRDIAQERTKQGYPNPEEEKLDLQRMEDEAKELVMLAELLVKKAQEGFTATRRSTGARRPTDILIKVEDASELKPTEKEGLDLVEEEAKRGVPTASPDEMHVMGEDKNIYQKPVQLVIRERATSPTASCTDLGLSTEADVPNGRGTSSDDAERLVILLDKANKSLKEEQVLKDQLEEKVQSKEKELEETRAKVAVLAAELNAMKASSQERHSKSGRSSSGKGSNKSGSSKRSSVMSRGSSRK